jgi:2-haloacid dehalogenase
VRPKEHGPNQNRDLKADGDWNAVGDSMIELAKKLGCS